MLKIKGYAIDADSYGYVVGELKTRKTKDGDTQEYISNPKYYGKLEDAFKAIVDAEHRRIIAENDQKLDDFLAKIKEANKELADLFRMAVTAND